jgi:endonuclease YncB( thermonuclease family)
MIKTILNKRGKYGRILGIIMVPSAKMSDGYVNINEQLVTEGHAERYKTTPR